MPPRKRKVAMMQGYRSPSPTPPSPPMVPKKSQPAKTKPGRKKRKTADEEKIVPWRKWIKVFKDGGYHPMSKITGKPLEPGGDLAEIATEPFNPDHDFDVVPYNYWLDIFLHMDVVTATVFSYTCRKFRAFLNEQSCKADQAKGKVNFRKLYLDFNPQASFPVPLNFRCASRLGNGVTIQYLIDGFMRPDYIYDTYVQKYRTVKDAQRTYEEFEWEIETERQEERDEEEARQDELRENWDRLVDTIRRNNQNREQRREGIRESSRQQAMDCSETYDSEDDEVSEVSLDQVLPDYEEFVEDPDLYMNMLDYRAAACGLSGF